MQRAAAVLIFVLLTAAPAAAADAGVAGRCYPPPCSAPAPGLVTTGDAELSTPAPVLTSGAAIDAERSPVPYVSIGLLGFTGFALLVALRRRTNIVRRRPEPVRPRRPAPAVRRAAPRLARSAEATRDGIAVP